MSDCLLNYYVCFSNLPHINDVWTDINRVPNTGKDRVGYDTQKPKDLIKRIILSSSNEGDLVADFFCGSGTTCIAAKELNRNYLGCDINPKAISITNQRLLNEGVKTEKE